MAYYTKLDRTKIAQTNKETVFHYIQTEGPINRAAIAKKMGLSVPSVMSITEGLIAQGIVQAVGKGESNGGKRPEMLSVVPDSAYYAGVDIGRSTVRFVIQDMAHKAIYGSMVATDDVKNEKNFVDWLQRYIIHWIEESEIDCSRLAGVGIAMPGLIEQETGHVLFSPDFDWSDIPLQSWLQGKLPYPVLVENANRALALSECQQNRCTHMERDTVLCVNLGYGIGGAVMREGQLYYGSSGTSGEIGHITVVRDGALCACGNTGCLEAVASGAAIAQQGRDLVQNGIPTTLRALCGGNLTSIDAKMVFDAAREGDPSATRLIDRATEYIGIGLAAAINLLDPDQVILCGGLAKNGSIFLDKVTASAMQHRLRQAGRHVRFTTGQRGEYSTAIGAALAIGRRGITAPESQG